MAITWDVSTPSDTAAVVASNANQRAPGKRSATM